MNNQQEQFQQLRDIARRIERDAMSPFRVHLFWLLGSLSLLILIYLAYPHLPGWASAFSLTTAGLGAFFVAGELLSLVVDGRSTWKGAFMVALASYKPVDHVSYQHLSNALIDLGFDITRVNMWLSEEGDRVAKHAPVRSPHQKAERRAVKRLKAAVGRA